jgi:hypothetical protein
MREASIAEWIMRRLTSKERASSIVGDLLETGHLKGSFRFWLAVAGVVLSLAWRPLLAFIAALYAWDWTLRGYMMTSLGIRAVYRPSAGWELLLDVLGTVGSYLWLAAVYMVIRYGVFDRFVQITLASAILVGANICYWWQPMALAMSLAVAVPVFWFSIRSGEQRRSVFALPVLLIAAQSSGLAFHVHVAWRHTFSEKWPEHWMALGKIILTVWITTVTCSALHRWVIRGQTTASESDNRLAG